MSLNTPDAEITNEGEVRSEGLSEPDPKGDRGSASSGRRVSERSLEIAEKFKGKVMGTRQIELSADLKILTMTVRLEGQNRPKRIMVFDRE